MRQPSKSPNGLEVLAVSGTHVITLGINLPESERNGLHGFSIERKDHFSGKTDWLEGLKVFPSVIPAPNVGATHSSEIHPIQDFFWSDFTVRPERKYTYTIHARKGTPQNLTNADQIAVEIETESYSKSHKHSIYFNRGVAGSQAFVKKFGTEKFSKIAEEKIWVWEWLSRGLREALTDYLNEATDNTYSIRAAIYEFQFEPILTELFNAAKKRGVDVKVIYDSTPDSPNKKDPSNPKIYKTRKDNDEAIKNTGIGDLVIKRTKCGAIPHNKFFIILKDNVPVAVWTGSTNITTGGIHGHSNVGHIVRDKAIAKKYMDYWNFLEHDPDVGAMRANCLGITADFSIKNKLSDDFTEVVFSPRQKVQMLDWYAGLSNESRKPVFLTVPFGLDTRFEKILQSNDSRLFYVISDKPDKGLLDPAIAGKSLNRIAHGGMLDKGNQLLGWMKERLTGLNKVNYLHTKYLLIDPLGSSPVVISGSANFSKNSTVNNDENMLIIKGDKRVADIYFGEFLRIFRHFYFRSIIKDVAGGDTSSMSLDETGAWADKFYDQTSPNFAERLYFSGN
ncbi:MAG: phospholipase D-like domain-containing protein [Pyrinomonadaceae bacterium]